MNRLSDHLERNSLVFYIPIGVNKKIIGIFTETKKTESLSQFHNSAGFGLFGGGAFTHLFFCPNGRARIIPANAEKNRDVQSAIINSYSLLKNIKIGLL